MTVEERLSSIEAKVDQLLVAVHGNGQPGLITRLAKVEERVDYRVKIGGAAGAVGSVAAVLAMLLAKVAGVE